MTSPQLDAFGRELAGVMTNPLRIQGVTCTICTREVDLGYQMCFKCREHRGRYDPPQAGIAGGSLTSDLVVPLTYAVQGFQAYTDMFKYKEAVSFEAAQRRLLLLAAVFVRVHQLCIGRATGQAVSLLAVLPSLGGRVGQHPLEHFAPLFPQAWHRVHLNASPDLPADRNQRRELNPDFYQCPYNLAGHHVLLLDDTWVSGGHAQGAAVRLRQAGASRVTILVLARMLKTDYPPTAEFVRRHNLPHRPYDIMTCPVTGAGCP